MKILILAAMAAAFVTYNESAWESATGFVQTALNPVYAWSTDGQITELTGLLNAEAAAGRSVPLNRSELQVLVATGYRSRDLTEDAWGQPFHLERSRFSVRIVSAGPDGLLGTEDDLKGKPVAVVPR